MGSRLLLLKLPSPTRPLSSFNNRKLSSASELLSRYNCYRTRRCFTKATYGSSLQPPNLPRLAETARISLTPDEVEEFAPKIRQVIDWFGQLQAVDLSSVDLSSVDPAIRADTEGENLRDDIPQPYEKREAAVAAIPSYEEPYIKVPKVLNKE